MQRIRFGLLCLVVAGFGCQGGDEHAPGTTEPEHNTLGTWPNQVVVNPDPAKDPKIDAQKTAADLLFDILDEAAGDAGTPALPWAQFKDIVDKVQRCGRHVNAPPHTVSAHTAKLLAALDEARKGTAAGWTACAGELEHGH